MSDPLVEELAKKFIDEVRDRTLRQRDADFLGTWAVVQNNRIFKGLIEPLDDAQKDLLWELLANTVDRTIDATLRFVDHKRVTGEMRVTLIDRATGARVLLTEADDVTDLYWFEWLGKYARATERPKTRRSAIVADELPPALVTAVAEDFPGAQILAREKEVRVTDGVTIVYHLLLSGHDAPIAFRPTGGRARVT